MAGHQVAYIRVNSYDQTTERQLEGIKFDETFTARQIGLGHCQTSTESLFKASESRWHHLHVHSIDRLASNLKNLQDLVEDLTERSVVVQLHNRGSHIQW